MSSTAGTVARSGGKEGFEAIVCTVLRDAHHGNGGVAFRMHFVTSLVLHHGPA
jgi:hypothetical protein